MPIINEKWIPFWKDGVDKETEIEMNKFLNTDWYQSNADKLREEAECDLEVEQILKKQYKKNRWSKETERAWWNNHYAYQAPEFSNKFVPILESNTFTKINQQNDLNKPATSKVQPFFKKNI